MPSPRRSAITLAAVVTAGVLSLANVAASRTQRDTIPDRIADSTFWRMVTEFSEPSGVFPSENFVSNETEWQYVIPGALGRVKSGGAYVGVGPEQNFTYIAAFHPKIAFICDIRRQNMILQLMYKALVEMSRDRAGFLSMLWSRPRPEGLDSSSTPAAILAAYQTVNHDSSQFVFTLDAIFARLVNQHKFALTSDDSAALRAVYAVFYTDGPAASYSSSSSRRQSPFGALPPNGVSVVGPGMIGTMYINNGGMSRSYRITTDSLGRVSVMRDSSGVMVPDTTYKAPPPLPYGGFVQFPTFGSNYATFGALMTEDDGTGVNRGWLGSETAFRWLKDFETRNLLVPVVGNFAGTKALRAVGNYLKSNEIRVSAFYTSNVEQYLFQNGVNAGFYDNVAALPADSSSIFIRSFPNTVRGGVMPRKPNSRLAQTTSSIYAVIQAHRDGALITYADLARLQDQ